MGPCHQIHGAGLCVRACDWLGMGIDTKSAVDSVGSGPLAPDDGRVDT